jgi:hypothetical protein
MDGVRAIGIPVGIALFAELPGPIHQGVAGGELRDDRVKRGFRFRRRD